jgi:hypothetical protein
MVRLARSRREISSIFSYIVDSCKWSRRFEPRRGVRSSPGQGASGSRHLPWALPRVLQVIPKIKRDGGGEGCHAGRACGIVCSKGARSAFVPVRRASAIAASIAGRRRGSGRSGRRSNDTGRRRRANRNATGKASATASASKPGNHQRQRWLATPRGSSLPNIFFDRSCDRPGCYEGFVLQPRSPLQHFCSPACRRALERVQKRERRWIEARDLIPTY